MELQLEWPILWEYKTHHCTLEPGVAWNGNEDRRMGLWNGNSGMGMRIVEWE